MRILLATGLTKLSELEGKDKKINLYIDQTKSPKIKMMVPCVRVRPITTMPELPQLKDDGINEAIAWINKNKTTIEAFKKIRKVTPKQEAELKKLLNV